MEIVEILRRILNFFSCEIEVVEYLIVSLIVYFFLEYFELIGILKISDE